MSKKRKDTEQDPMDMDMDLIGSIMQFVDANPQFARMITMDHMFEMNVTPQEYEAFYNERAKEAKNPKRKNPLKKKSASKAEIEGANDKSLRLKIQMKGITKPPMWREVIIPANYTFLKLHQVIQTVTGLSDCHLWEYRNHAYAPGPVIGIPVDDSFGFGAEEVTDDAETTPVTAFLTDKGDKLEYVYDFGDDWIFVVTLLEVIDKPAEYPTLVKWKGELQAIDDTGGPYMYPMFREFNTLPKKDQKQIAYDYGYDSASDISNMILDAQIEPDQINTVLSQLY